MASKVPLDISAEKQQGLRRYNLIAGAFHAIQAIAIIALSTDFKLPVHINYLQGPPIPGVKFEQVDLFSIPVGFAVAAFSIMSWLQQVHGGFEK